MDATSPRWREMTVSEYPWERDALAFVRGRLPDVEPYRVWSNFEFLADDGSINEVDLLALTPKGFFLVEIKSAPGVVTGDQGTWTWRSEGRTRTLDNPLLLANRKAKKLAALLRRQPALQPVRSPFLEAHVFLSHEAVECRLPEALRDRVHLRDAGAGSGERPGIAAALMRFGAGTPPRRRLDRPLARALDRALEEAGIRPSQAARRVGDYRLDELLLEGPGYQDWTARHVAIESERARVRIYGAPRGISEEARAARRRAAQREYRILQDVRHDGILAAKAYTDHALGPALVFAHRDGAQRFDHWLAERAERLDVDVRLHLLRQVAEAVRHAHAKRLVHRALSPQSLLVLDPAAALPRVRICNWQTGARRAADTGPAGGPATSGASRLGDLIEDAAWIYLAPEAVTDHGAPAEQSDVFSLGALAYHLFSGRPPASSLLEMTERLRMEQGLRISSVLDGAGERLQRLVQDATHPEVTMRLESVAGFLQRLDEVEDELTAPEVRARPDPVEARQGDELEHGFVVRRRLGKGSTALALLVERGGREQVLKVALSPAENDRLEAEADVLRRLRHQSIVELHDVLGFGDRVGLLLARAGRETLADRLRAEGRLHLELLERFGEDLLAAVDWLEQQGIPHRDVKPENLGVAMVGSQMHLVLFDFSLARTPAANVRAGTRPYLDPFLALRRPPRWDTHAERFAAAVTLYEMASGALPRWGDGQSEPAVLDCEAAVDADAFEPAVREGLTAFFGRALRRDFRARFDNAQEMLRAWRQVFLAAARPETDPDPAQPAPAPAVAVGEATLDTLLGPLGLSARGLHAAERMNVRTVRELLRFPLIQVNRMRGVGSRTRRELTTLARRLAARFPDAAAAPKTAPAGESGAAPATAARASVDALQRLLLPAGRTGRTQRDAGRLAVLLGLDGGAGDDGGGAARGPRAPSGRGPDGSGGGDGSAVAPGFLRLASPGDGGAGGSAAAAPWPSQSDAARALGIAPAGISHALARARRRWSREAAFTRLRHDVVELLEAHGGVMTVRELADALLAQRGSVQAEPVRSRHAAACVRAAAEVEGHLAGPRWIVRRIGGPGGALIARDALDEPGAPRIDGAKLADFAERLGRTADELAQRDPLPSPARALEALLAVPAPAGVEPPPPNRLPALAAAASDGAALSRRSELYPRGMAPARTLKLALGALAGAPTLDPEAIRKRVAGRFADAAPLPDRPALDALLIEAGSGLRWNAAAAGGRGAYEAPPLRTFVTVSAGTGRTRTSGARRAADAPAAPWGAGDDFEQRLRRALEQQAFLALTVAPRRLAEAERALAAAFAVDVRGFDALLIRHMREAARDAGADWDVVLRADRQPRDGADWATLLRLVEHRALPRVRAELAAAPRTVLLTNLGLLARYGRMTFLDALRDAAGRADGPPGVWLLAPNDEQEARPMIDGRPVPVFTAAQWARVPREWLAARRSAAGAGEAAP